MIEIDSHQKNASYINKLNKITVLNLIRKTGEISRADIVKKTNLSAPTITRIVDQLIEDKLVMMVGKGSSTGGRPPQIVRFDGTEKYVIGIDLGSTNIRGVVSNLDGVFVTEIEIPTELDQGYEIICKQVGSIVEKLIVRSRVSEDKILGIGMAVAGMINRKTRLVEYSPVFNWWKLNLKAELQKHIPKKFPFYFDNVSRVTALGELYYGIGKKYSNFICVNAGFGIGAGIIINRVPLYGTNGFTGEIGHMVIDSHSDHVGKDGIKGGLEALASGYGIAEIAKSELKKGRESSLSSYKDLQEITAKEVVEAAKNGDPLAMEVFDNATRFLGLAIDAMIKIFNPQAVVINGGLTRSGDFFYEKLKSHVSKNLIEPVDEQVKLLPSSFNEDATLIGAFSLIISKVFQFDTTI